MTIILSDIGTTLLQIALFICVAQGVIHYYPHLELVKRWMPALAIGNFISLSAAFAMLVYAFAVSDFSVLAVYEHSHSLKPLLYKITGSWGNHEGSIILWCWVMALYNMMLATTKQSMTLPIRLSALSVFGWMQAAFISYTVFTSNPFGLIIPTPAEGTGLNPLLQDIGLAIHPPLLYLGYIGFAACFALSLGILKHSDGKKTSLQQHASLLHPWIMLPWSALTLGIGLGSWWAYRELGWGGWWFWDPVENASFLPWLAATALFHSNLIMRRTGNFARWVLLLCLTTFILSMMGTFLVRSGILTSVHSFANDPERGVSILVMITALCAYALYIYWKHSPRITRSDITTPKTISAAILLNNILLLSSVVMILLAMLYPLILEAFGLGLVSIGAEYYQASFRLICIPLLFGCGISFFAPYTAQQKIRVTSFYATLCLSIILTLGIILFSVRPTLLYAIGMGASVWLVLSVLSTAYHMIKKRAPLRRIIAMAVGHFSLACFALAATVNVKYTQEYEVVTAASVANSFNDYTATINKLRYRNGENYISRHAEVTLEYDNQSITLFPEERFYPVAKQFTSEAYIQSFLTYDLYATVTKSALEQTAMHGNNAINDTETQFQLRIMRNPLMLLLWLSVILLAASGLIAVYQNNRNTHD